MKHRKTLKVLYLASLLLASLASLHATDVANLRCEYVDNPLGIDVAKPRLSWIISDPKSEIPRGLKQTAYQILVASSEELLKKEKGDLWDSGKVESDQSVQVEYAGKPLASRQCCYWKVRVWTRASDLRPPTASTWSKPASWTMGLLKPEDWQAKWIGVDKANPTSTNLLGSAQWIWFPEGDPAASAPAGVRYFRRAIAMPADRKMVKATVQLTADNACEIYVNGKSAGHGENFKIPVSIDITGMLQEGSNTLAIAATNAGESPNPAGLIAALKVEFADGAPLVICSDAQWKANPVKAEGWEQAGFDDALWVPAKSLGTNGMVPWGTIEAVDARPLPARYLRREFAVEKKVMRATAYVCGLGFFDFYVNGRKVSDQIMNPALSDYRKADYYVTFDITDQLKDGTNALGVVLGNGRFFAPRLVTPAATVDYGYPKLLLQAEIQYTDGSTRRIVSDENWKLTTEGPIRTNNEYDGEEYDARKEMPGWCRAGFDDTKWEKAGLVSAPGGVLLAQMIEPMRVTQVIKPVGITNPKPGTYIVDMGQNFYGAIRLKAKAPAGTEVRMVCAYSLLPDGMLKTADNRGAKATDVYVFKGEGEEVWTPQFKGQGFRRVQVTGFPGTPTVENFEGLNINTDARPVGEFECSNELVTRIHRAMWWGFRMYLRSAPLDPDRDERQAWMGDPAKDAESEAFNFHVASFYSKWMDDVRRSQRGDGTIPDVSMNWEWNSNVEWPSVFTIIPDWFLDFYADQKVVETQYEAMKRWVQAMMKNNLGADGTLKEGPYGDWCDTYTMDGKRTDNGNTPQDLIATAYQYNNCRIMARAAKLLKKPEDEKLFGEWADQLKLAFNKKFLNPITGVYLGGTHICRWG
jgi:alpha-L-rhamnosidase